MNSEQLVIEGRVAWIFGDNFDIDLVIGMENIPIQDAEKLAQLCMYKFDPKFREKVKTGDVVIGGKNFGYGHAHPNSLLALKEVGIRAIVAESFSPLFFRGETAGGFVLIPCKNILDYVKLWDVLRIDVSSGEIVNISKDERIRCTRLGDPIIQRIQAGGVYNYISKKLSLS